MDIITTPIYYVNGEPHIGHAYTSVLADVYSRYNKLFGNDTVLFTGTDEHGQKILDTSIKLNIPVEDFILRNRSKFYELNSVYDISFLDVINTTNEDHKNNVKNIWDKLKANGDIYQGEYEGWYSVREESFVKESDLINQNGTFVTKDGEIVKKVTEKNHFFKVTKYKNNIIEFLHNNKDIIFPRERYNEVLSFINDIEDVSISRSKTWGIDIEENETVYVWFDALINYITIRDRNNIQGGFTHFIGKDILRFHSVLWFALLFALDEPLPKKLFVNGWWTKDGKKISKSLGNVVDPFKLVDDYGLDVVRYFFCKNKIGSDIDFRDDLIKETNNFISNNLGNLVQRVLTLVLRKKGSNILIPGDYTLEDTNLLNDSYNLISDCKNDFPNINKIISNIDDFCGKCNFYINEQKPWAQEDDRTNTIFYVLINSILNISEVISPVMPSTSDKIKSFIKKDNNGIFVEKSEILFKRVGV